MFHTSIDGKNAYDIRREHPECPIKIPTGARCMTSAKIDFEGVQDLIIEWYEREIKGVSKAQN